MNRVILNRIFLSNIFIINFLIPSRHWLVLWGLLCSWQAIDSTFSFQIRCHCFIWDFLNLLFSYFDVNFLFRFSRFFAPSEPTVSQRANIGKALCSSVLGVLESRVCINRRVKIAYANHGSISRPFIPLTQLFSCCLETLSHTFVIKSLLDWFPAFLD